MRLRLTDADTDQPLAELAIGDPRDRHELWWLLIQEASRVWATDAVLTEAPALDEQRPQPCGRGLTQSGRDRSDQLRSLSAG